MTIFVRIAILIVGLAIACGVDARAAAVAPVPAHRYFGWLAHAQGATLTLRLRTGRLLVIDASAAFAAARVAAPLFAGKPVCVDGFFAPRGVFRAVDVQRAVAHPAAWGGDR
jgi:hypothetical protein